jgi:hypothetical protein
MMDPLSTVTSVEQATTPRYAIARSILAPRVGAFIRFLAISASGPRPISSGPAARPSTTAIRIRYRQRTRISVRPDGHRPDSGRRLTTNHRLERVRTDTERDYFMTATAAEAYGLIDEVIVASGSSHAPVALPSPKNRAA